MATRLLIHSKKKDGTKTVGEYVAFRVKKNKKGVLFLEIKDNILKSYEQTIDTKKYLIKTENLNIRHIRTYGKR